MLREEVAGRAVVDVAGHDVPGDRAAGVARVRQQLLGEQLKQGLVLDRRDGELTLGPVVSEARSLPAGDEERADLSLPQQLVAAPLGVGVELTTTRVVLARESLHRLDILRQRSGGLVSHVRVGEFGD